MTNYINIGSVPNDESCAQLGHVDYHILSRKESRAYINQLRRVYGEEPEGCAFHMKSFPHEFGSYREVVCYYDVENEAARAFAFKTEAGCDEWDDEARKELGL